MARYIYGDATRRHCGGSDAYEHYDIGVRLRFVRALRGYSVAHFIAVRYILAVAR